MKINIKLLFFNITILVVLFNVVYFFVPNLLANFKGEKEKIKIDVIKIDQKVYNLPDLLEVNFFETQKDVDNWIVRPKGKKGIEKKLSSSYITQGKYSMEIKCLDDKFSRLIFFHFPRNWGSYRYLSFDIINPSDEDISFEFIIGNFYNTIYLETKPNNFSLKTSIKPGLNRYKIDIRDIEKYVVLEKVRKIINLRIFKPSIIYIDNIRLER